ncbi:galactokinase [Cryptosporangium aurantiacum]|uniref:Galactokinase n=1 Tax=Cryptosporangium aurantiacum TaxID=134849 RepID=A0A1M7JXQ7_9ACTN|nr:galactokinase [Cryptosporangium aurantiacum]SHM57829.1 galactokinase [Cryptosporangium aurantiacum]
MRESASWLAPGRVNLIGEHTDYNDGFVLPLAIEFGCRATVSPGPEGMLRFTSAQEPDPVEVPVADLAPGAVPGWAAYPAGVLWALGVDLPGLTVAVDSDVPLGAGLSSSAALTCSVGGAANDLLELGLSPRELVAATRKAENDFVGAPTGGMDQLASMLGEAGSVLFCDMRTLDVRPVPFGLDAEGLALLVVDSRAPHRHADGEYAARRRSCEQAASTLGLRALRDVVDLDEALAKLAAEPDGEVLVKRARHIVTENARVTDVVALLDAGKVREIGPALTASHASMRDDFEITVPEVDVLVEALLAAGAYGARMTGGGFGGCVIALLDQNAVDDAARAAVAAATAHGFATPRTFTTSPAAGAHSVGAHHAG